MAHTKWPVLERNHLSKNGTSKSSSTLEKKQAMQYKKEQKATKPKSFAQQADQAQANAQRKHAQASKAYENYNRFLNSQTDVDSIDFLRDGGSTSNLARSRQNDLWKTYTNHKVTANTAQAEAEEKQAAYISILKRPQESVYQAMRLPELEALLPYAQEEVNASQAAYLDTEAKYSALFSQTDVDDLQIGTWTADQEQCRSQLQKELDEASQRLSQAILSRDILTDVYTYRNDMQTISNMSESNRIALELCTNGLNIGKNIKRITDLTPEQRKQLRATGNYYEILNNPRQYLKRSGYTSEDISRMAETYGRYLNAQDMENTEKTAQAVGNTLPVLGTLSTYPAKLLGDISADLTALGSTVASDLGISHYNSIDTNHPGYRVSVYTDSLRDTVSDNLGGLGDLYDGVNGAADELVQYAAAGATGIPAFHYVGDLGSTVRDATTNGATRDQAMSLGIGNTARNAISNFTFADSMTPKNWISWENLRKQGRDALIEQGVAFAADYTKNRILDLDEDYSEYVAKLMQAGMDEDAARKAAYYHTILNTLHTETGIP